MKSRGYSLDVENLRSFKLYSLARRAASRLGLPADSVDDCAMEFVHKSLTNPTLLAADEAYQWAAAVNQVRDCWKRERRLRRHESALDDMDIAPGENSTDSMTSRLGFWDVAYCALEKMPAEQRHAFVRRFVEDESVGQIARDLGKSPSAVSALQFRACAAMKRRLREMGYDESALREILRADIC